MTTLRAPPFCDASHVLKRLETTHRRQTIVPSSDPTLAYALPVPKGWGRVQGLGAHAAAGHPEILGIFAPDPDIEGPRIIVSATRLRWDVDPAEWVRHGWELAGWSIAMARPLDARWHPRFEVGGLKVIDGRVEVRRATGFVDNGRLLRVDVAGPSSTWGRMHDVLWPCGPLMALERPTYRREVEPQVHRGGPHMEFCLPESWSARPKPPPWLGTTRWVAEPIDGAQGSVGLRIEATRWPLDRPESIEVRQHRLHHELWTDGIALARQPKRISSGSALGTAGLVGIYVAHAHDREQTFELRFAHRDVNGWSFDYTAVIASPERCPLDRMRAIRALEIAVATTQIRPKEHTTHAA
ncbi:hypothetical protein [Paraliomyxa miuraensis]|uniref:hypothetical protein n=1 Tax=Paraliomyxa miuraensis TaxID=376150 RepID=UPI002254F688|nr:hypothetical protein [Paraliomyxa miuraensis]MCX4240176.1 LpqN/LpqT family lipoprotein [Paraliomyxa miuraensis]